MRRSARTSLVKHENSDRAYRSDWRIFCEFCVAMTICHLPALPSTLIAFVLHELTRGKKGSTVGRRIAAIRMEHLRAGYEPPTNSQEYRTSAAAFAVLADRNKQQKRYFTDDEYQRCVDAIDTTKLDGLCDLLIFLLGAAAALSRSQLINIRCSDIHFNGGIAFVFIRSRGDGGDSVQLAQTLAGHNIADAIVTWIDRAELNDGFLLRKKRSQDRQLQGRTVADVVKRYATHIGLDPAFYSGHSLRRTPLRAAVGNGASLAEARRLSGHLSSSALYRCAGTNGPLRDHASRIRLVYPPRSTPTTGGVNDEKIRQDQA